MPEPDMRTQFEAALTEETYGAAWRYAWRLAAGGRGGCREEAEDLLQEALTHAWRQFGQLRDPAQFKAWLLAIVRTRFLNRLRTARRRPATLDELSPELAAPVEASEGGWLHGALRQLPPGERELLCLFYLEGLSLAETGQAAGLSARVVRQRLHRARERLRKLLHGRAAGSAAGTAPWAAPSRERSLL